MTRVTELTPLLKQLRLGQMAATLPERIALARREQLDYASFLEIILSDEVNRRAHRRIEVRLNGAGFEETCRLEDFDWSASVTLDRRLLDAVFSLEFLDKHEHVLLVGPAGVGKSFLAQALGYSAVRAGHTVRFSHADDFFRAMAQARVDNSVDRAFRSFLTPDLLILDDLGSPPAHRPAVRRPLRTHPQPPPVLQLHHHQQPGRSKNGSASSMIPSSATAPWTAWPTPATRSSSRAPATGNGCPHTAPCSTTKEVIDRPTTT